MSADLKDILRRKKGLRAAAPEAPAQPALPPIVVTPMNATEATAAAKEIGAAALVKADEAMQQAKTQAVRAAGALRRRLADARPSHTVAQRADAPSEPTHHSTVPSRRQHIVIALAVVVCISTAVGGWFFTHRHGSPAVARTQAPTRKAEAPAAPTSVTASQAPTPILRSAPTTPVAQPAVAVPVAAPTTPAAPPVVVPAPAVVVTPVVAPVQAAPTSKPVVKPVTHAAARISTATKPAWQDKANADMDAYLKSH